MVKVSQGDVFWYDFADPRGSEPGFERPVVVIQGDNFNHSSLATTIVVSLTTNTRTAAMPGNVVLPKKTTGLPQDTVANVTQLSTVDREFLRDRSGRISPDRLQSILRGVDLALGRTLA